MHLMKRFGLLLSLFTLMFASAAAAQERGADNLAGSRWTLVMFDGAAFRGEQPVTLEFNADNQAGGSGGCNSYGATYALDGESLGFSAVISTMMACPEGINSVDEIDYLAALEATTGYSLERGRLILTYGDEGRQMVFERAVTLAGTSWSLLSLGAAAALPDSTVSLTFVDEAQLAGEGGCNSYSASYAINGAALSISESISTLRACVDEAVGAQETAFFEALGAAAAFALEGDRLTITTAAGEALVFAQVDLLVGTGWQLDSLGGAALVAGSEITLEFVEGVGVTGSGGCNRYNGRYTLSGASLTIGEVISTRRACPDRATTEQEGAYFAALALATGYELVDDQLVITYGSGQQLRFSAAN
jgi:heat shock protein HslJ